MATAIAFAKLPLLSSFDGSEPDSWSVLPVSPAKNSSIHPDGELCVLLPSGGVHMGEATLLMRAKMFSASRNLLMRAYDREYLLFPLSVVEKTEEFDIGRYRILEQLD